MTDYLYIRQFVIGLALLFLSACDGGIFGTGDGEDPTVVVPGDTTEDGSMGEPVGNTMDPLPDNTNLSFVATDGVGSFNNNQITSNRNDAQIKFVNASPDQSLSLVAINNNMVEMPLLPLPGLTSAFRESGYLTINNPANAISLFNATDAASEDYTNPIISFDPITLATGSASTLVLRGVPGDVNTPLEMFAVSNQTTAADENALIRAIHAATGLSIGVDIVLQPSTTEPTNEITVETGFNYRVGITEYATLLPDTYDLIIRDTDNPDQLIAEPESITLESNEVVTLILLDAAGADNAGITIIRSQDSGL